MKWILFGFSCALAAQAETFISCHDGDTCRFSKDSKGFKFRLAGVDAPEKDQPLGIEARDFLVKMLQGKTIRLECNGKSYDREACAVYAGETDIQRELVRNGYAMDYPKYSKGKYKADEEVARSKNMGFWSLKDKKSPHCWRWLGTPECNKDQLYQPR